MNPTTQFPQIVVKIIKEQELIIGPLAWGEARKVQGLKIISEEKGEINFEYGDPKNVIDKLVAQYERIFGLASREVCKEAAASLVANLPPAEVPSSLK